MRKRRTRTKSKSCATYPKISVEKVKPLPGGRAKISFCYRKNGVTHHSFDTYKVKKKNGKIVVPSGRTLLTKGLSIKEKPGWFKKLARFAIRRGIGITIRGKRYAA